MNRIEIKNKKADNLFAELGTIGLLTICADCQNKNHFKILNFNDRASQKGISHGMCQDCFAERNVLTTG